MLFRSDNKLDTRTWVNGAVSNNAPWARNDYNHENVKGGRLALRAQFGENWTALFTYGFATMIVGGPFTERIFGWYGMGDWLITGIQTEDTNLTATVTLFVAVCVLVSGLLADLAYAALDPRIRV